MSVSWLISVTGTAADVVVNATVATIVAVNQQLVEDLENISVSSSSSPPVVTLITSRLPSVSISGVSHDTSNSTVLAVADSTLSSMSTSSYAAAAAAAAAAASCSTFRVLFNSGLIGLLCLFGSIGNGLSVAILRRDRHNKVAVYLLKALSLADGITLAVSFVVLSVFYGALPSLDMEGLLAARPYVVRYLNPVGYMSHSATVWMTVLLGLNRYVAVCRPFYRGPLIGIKSARFQVACVFILSIAFNLPRVFQYDIVDDDVVSCCGTTQESAINVTYAYDFNGGSTTNRPTFSNGNSSMFAWTSIAAATLSEIPESNSSLLVTAASGRRRYLRHRLSTFGKHVVYEVIYTNALYTSLVLILPLVLLVGVNTKLIIEMQTLKKKTRRNSLAFHHYHLKHSPLTPSTQARRCSSISAGSSVGSQESSITKVMIAIIVVLVVCHTPDRVVQILKLIAVDESWTQCPHALFFASNISNLLIVFNSSINFVIYYVFRKRFREILWYHLLRCARRRRDEVSWDRVRHSGSFPVLRTSASRASSDATATLVAEVNGWRQFRVVGFGEDLQLLDVGRRSSVP